jgi:hypothetical protein
VKPETAKEVGLAAMGTGCLVIVIFALVYAAKYLLEWYSGGARPWHMPTFVLSLMFIPGAVLYLYGRFKK